MRAHVFALTLGFLSSCVTPPAPIPMRAVRDASPTSPAKCLVVFLPGAGDHAEHFTRENFVSAIRERKLSVDLISTDATLGYYLGGSIIERLEQDVLAGTPHYEHTWFIGNSMGGHGSLLYPSRKPGVVTGVLALAPWLGNTLPQEIAKAGGLPSWQPGDGQEFERLFWSWLQRVTVKGEAGPELWLGFGTADRLANADEVLAAVLPPERVFRDEGGLHKWVTWHRLFVQFLEKSTFAEQCRP
ncbi:MAG: hypothetical protein JNM17_31270 [Archangium sp.]|nr:hypothetical protein [Archangium sp.]